MNDNSEQSTASRARVGRRDVLALGAGLVVGAGAVAGADRWGGGTKKAAAGSGGKGTDPGTEEKPPRIRRFVSTYLSTVAVETWTADGAEPAPGLLFTTPRTSVFHGLVLDNDGEPVWIEPEGQTITDLRVQTYRGKPVLTYWSGEVAVGTGIGAGHLLDESYQRVATVRGGQGSAADLHEFKLTERGTALLIGYPVVHRDLSEIGGPEDGYLYDCRVQEVDVATGEVLLDWRSLSHLDLAESHEELGDTGGIDAPYDPFHINSVEAHEDTLVLSARHTSALYSLDRRTGEIRWRMGGKNSDFEIAEDAEFASQHDARVHPDGTLTLFDNHGQSEDPAGAVSAGLVLDLDEKKRTVTLRRAFRNDDHYGYAMGSFELLEGGHRLVGWGTDPSLTEFDAEGTPVFGVDGIGAGTYRAYRAEWTGRPTSDPDVGVVDSGAGKIEVHASWNGATEVVRWRVLTGRRPGDLTPAATVRRTGFETATTVARAEHVAMQALAADGRVLGTSHTLAV
ncbi:ArsR family transcriptional regulator [Nocardioides sp. JQ2195]|uniref:arylsulfotransferase family protein n=1 Tax=Nocardioides sp. JQ2195 TaxID=2592334 RepID=UPI00143EEBEE|nr:arylsulfotransferase family protein [Nocardioides sp. JQ2195]QIX25829.1 ArsR family transcriptional regulator [Nocardioides sp. JQ2195]